MQLIIMHKILMGTAICCGCVFSAWSVFNWSQTGQNGALLMGAVSAVTTVAIGLYLRNFVRKNRTS